MPLQEIAFELDDMVSGTNENPFIGRKVSPRAAMQIAIQVARLGTGYVAPNPLVGAVCVDQQHRLVSTGAHLKCGEAHAEVLALKRAIKKGHEPKSLTIYVTLEPCAHHGRTPSCATMLRDIGVKAVKYGVKDPNPFVSGAGAARLIRAGIPCEQWPELVDQASRLAEVFLHSQLHNRPYIAAKIASDRNGIIALQGDRRRFITGKRSRAFGHYLRMRYDAIAVGSDTLILDNPTLSPRDIQLQPRNPLKVILDRQGRAWQHFCQNQSKPNVIGDDPEQVLWFIEAKHMPVSPSWGIHPVAADSVAEQLEVLQLRGATSLLLEGGAGIWHSFAEQNCIDRVHWFVSTQAITGTHPLNIPQSIVKIIDQNPVDSHFLLGEDDYMEMGCSGHRC